MGSAIAKTITANVCKAGLARLQRVDIEQPRAPQAALAKLLFASSKMCNWLQKWLMQPRLADCRDSSCLLYCLLHCVRTAEKRVQSASRSTLRIHQSTGTTDTYVTGHELGTINQRARTNLPTGAMPRGSAITAHPTFATFRKTIRNGLNPRTRWAGAAVATSPRRAPQSFGACFAIFRLRWHGWVGAAAAATRARSRWSRVLPVGRFTRIALVLAIAFAIVIARCICDRICSSFLFLKLIEQSPQPPCILIIKTSRHVLTLLMCQPPSIFIQTSRHALPD